MAEMWVLQNGDSEEEEEAPVAENGKLCETWEYHPLWAWGFLLLKHGYFLNEMYHKADMTKYRKKEMRRKESRKENEKGRNTVL